MGKIFYGERGSGKTIKLLRQAQALSYEGKIPVIVCCHKAFQENLKETAKSINIDTTNFIFTTFSEFKEAQGKYNDDVYRIMIDELTVFIQYIETAYNGIHSYIDPRKVNYSRSEKVEFDKRLWQNKVFYCII